jgi:hypothetical protein
MLVVIEVGEELGRIGVRARFRKGDRIFHFGDHVLVQRLELLVTE